MQKKTNKQTNKTKNNKKKNRIYRIWFLFGTTPGIDSYSRHFGAIIE